MSVRIKLLTGYSIFVFALVILGGWSAWRLREMGDVSRRIISNNYDSVIAAQDMKESLERQDSAALFALQGERERALRQMREHRTRFDAAFERAANNITEPGEREIVNRIRQERDAYYETFDHLLTDTGMPLPTDLQVETGQSGIRTRGQAIYFSQLESIFDRLRARCNDLLRLNQGAMQAKSEAAGEEAERYFRFTLLIAGALVAAGIALAFFLANSIVAPLRELTQTTVRIAGGDLDAKAEISSHDEIGLLAAEYNRMAERIRQLRRTDKGKLLIAQAAADASINSLDDPLLIVGVDGRIARLNHAAERVLGASSSVIGKAITEIKGNETIISALAEAANQTEAASSDAAQIASLGAARIVNHQGQTFRVVANRLQDTEGLPLGTIIRFEDITQLRQLDEAKGSLLERVIAEAREPLLTARTAIHVLLTEKVGDLSTEQTNMLYDARRSCEQVEDALQRSIGELHNSRST